MIHVHTVLAVQTLNYLCVSLEQNSFVSVAGVISSVFILSGDEIIFIHA